MPSYPVELKLIDFLTSQLDRELIAHNTIVAGHKKRVDDVLKEDRELLEASSSLRKEKIRLEEKLLSWLLELQKALDEVSNLQEKIDFAQSEIFLLGSRSTRAVPRSCISSASSEPSEVAWRVVIR